MYVKDGRGKKPDYRDESLEISQSAYRTKTSTKRYGRCVASSTASCPWCASLLPVRVAPRRVHEHAVQLANPRRLRCGQSMNNVPCQHFLPSLRPRCRRVRVLSSIQPTRTINTSLCFFTDIFPAVRALNLLLHNIVTNRPTICLRNNKQRHGN